MHTLKKFWPGLGAGLVLWLTGCGPVASTGSPPATVQVAYAGSLALLNEQAIGPAFHRATGYAYQGRGGGSYGLAHELSSGTIHADVFESIGYGPIAALATHSPGWAVQYAASPLVVAYNPRSPYAGQLNAIRAGREPLSALFTLMATPGFHLGRTNPDTDPQGQAFLMMLQLAVRQYHLPANLYTRIIGSPQNSRQIYSEEGILSLLQAGGLDASSAFLSEAVQRHLSYIKLPAPLNFGDPAEAAWYRTAHLTLSSGRVVTGKPLTIDITALGRHPSPGALAFIRFQLSARARRLYTQMGYTLLPATVVGQSSRAPAGLTPKSP